MMVESRPSILALGPAQGRGGVAAVMRLLSDSRPLTARYEIKTVSTSAGNEAGVFTQAKVLSKALCQFAALVSMRKTRVIHVHASADTSFARKLPFLALGRLFRKELIFHIHSSHFDFYVANRNRFIRRVIERVFTEVDLVVVLADEWKRLIQAAFPSVGAEKIVVIRNPVEASSPKDPLVDGVRRVLFLGAFTRSKGIEDLIEAAGMLTDLQPEVEVVLCGAGPEEQHVRERTRELGLEKQVVFAGWVSGEEKWRRMREASVLVLPSYKEGMPIALLEGMAMGLPLVATRIAAVPEIVEERRNGLLVEPGDIEGLASRLRLLLENERLRETMSRYNVSDAAAFGVDRVGRIWDEVYRALDAGKTAAFLQSKLEEAGRQSIGAKRVAG